MKDLQLRWDGSKPVTTCYKINLIRCVIKRRYVNYLRYTTVRPAKVDFMYLASARVGLYRMDNFDSLSILKNEDVNS